MGCLTVARIQPARVGVQRSHTNATARRTHHGGLGNSSFVSHPQWRTSRAREISCNGLFGLGAPEIAVIVGVVALIYGPSKLPELGKGLGKTAKSFQSAAKEFEKELKSELKDGEKAEGEESEGKRTEGEKAGKSTSE